MPRAPQTEQERNRIRQRILDAAHELFDKAGIEGVSMRAVGARVGLTASALYAYFPGKAQLMRALWRNALEELLRKFLVISTREPDPIAAIRALAQAYADFAMENPARFHVVHMVDRQDPAPGLEDGGLREAAYQVLRLRVAEAIAQGRLRVSDPDLVSQMLWTGLHGVLNLTTAGMSFPFLPSSLLIPSMIDTLLTGVERSGSSGMTEGAVS